MEDIVTVIDGRPEIVSEIKQASEALKAYLVAFCSELLKERDFLDALPGHLLPDAASQSRSVVIIDRLKEIARGYHALGKSASDDSAKSISLQTEALKSLITKRIQDLNNLTDL